MNTKQKICAVLRAHGMKPDKDGDSRKLRYSDSQLFKDGVLVQDGCWVDEYRITVRNGRVVLKDGSGGKTVLSNGELETVSDGFCWDVFNANTIKELDHESA